MRRAQVTRNTLETQINIDLNLDGVGKSTLETGVPFFDHMLDQLISLYRLIQPATPRTDEILPVPGRASSSRDRT